VLQDLGRPSDAAASAQQALAARPAWPDALLALGNALQALERHIDAVEASTARWHNTNQTTNQRHAPRSGARAAPR
jgi:tetratricopeptide (TPR) repeat protein